MSATEFEHIIRTLREIRSDNYMSLTAAHTKLTKDFGKDKRPSLQRLIDWTKRQERPIIYDLARELSPNGNISFGIYYYPQVKQEVSAYYKKSMGRKRGWRKRTQNPL
jgi:hypothetical protein